MRVYIKVIPKASKNEIIKISEGEYRAKVMATPENNKANELLIEVLADFFDVSKSLVKIVGGKTARTKIIDIGV